MAVKKLKLGEEVKDSITGFVGITVARVEYITGCVQYCVQAKCDEKNVVPDGLYFDEQRLGLLKAKPKVLKSIASGGPQSNTPASTYKG